MPSSFQENDIFSNNLKWLSIMTLMYLGLDIQLLFNLPLYKNHELYESLWVKL